jgi:hypothetical protein
MLVHCFWLFEFKFKFEFICLCSFQNGQTPFVLPLSLPLFWPIFVRSPTARSLSAPLQLFTLARLRRSLQCILAQPAQKRRQPISPLSRARSR